MTLRSIHTNVAFSNPFNLAGLDEELPAGIYAIETEEELLEGVSFPVYRRVNTTIQLQPVSSNHTTRRAMSIDPVELDAALSRDKTLTDPFANIDLDVPPEGVDDGGEPNSLADEKCTDAKNSEY